MSRVVVVGATGHIGSYLVPRVVADRQAEDAEGTFGARVAALRPDAVIDLICFTAASARQLLDALRPSRPLLVHCGTIWVHGPALQVPVTEDEPRTAYGEYGTGKAEIEALLHRETLAGGVPAIVLHPGHISGPGWPVITPAGNLDPAVWTRLATGQLGPVRPGPGRPVVRWTGGGGAGGGRCSGRQPFLPLRRVSRGPACRGYRGQVPAAGRGPGGVWDLREW